MCTVTQNNKAETDRRPVGVFCGRWRNSREELALVTNTN